MTSRVRLLVSLTALLAVGLEAGAADKPSVEQALKLRPIQTNVEYDIPTRAEAAKSTLTVESVGKHSGWTVRNEDRVLLRRFIDTNDDNKVDLWCYFKDGVEVYRDIDGDYNGKADQYRWLGTAGTRWGIDKNENGSIDQWKSISAEEVSAEVVASLREGSSQRFTRLLLTPSELSTLGLGDSQKRELAKRLDQARKDFASLMREQKVITRQTQWIHFGATLPGVVPAGTDGLEKDIRVYENVVAVIETDGKHGQIPIGTLIQVGNTWRAIDLPVGIQQGQANALTNGFFFASSRAATTPAPTSDNGSDQWQQWIRKLEDVDQRLLKARTTAEQSRLNTERADVIEKLIEALPADQRETWIRQFADTVSAAIQSGQYPGGVDRLQRFYQQVDREVQSPELRAYVKFRYISAEYGRKLNASVNDPKADMAAIQKQWLKDLADYVKAFPKAPDAAEAMLQLAIAEEFSGNDTGARNWYRRIASEFPDDRRAAKARGALTRLESVGRIINLRGTTTSGKTVDLASYRGKVVLVHYWATWCEPCKEDLKLLEAARKKYEAKGFRLIGISLDNDDGALAQYLRNSRLAWPQIHEQGGLDGRLANELGILTLPTMLLVGADGKVVNRAVHASLLDEELGKLLK